MLRNHYVEKTIYWENIMFRKCYVEKTLCTKNIMLRKHYVEKTGLEISNWEVSNWLKSSVRLIEFPTKSCAQVGTPAVRIGNSFTILSSTSCLLYCGHLFFWFIFKQNFHFRLQMLHLKTNSLTKKRHIQDVFQGLPANVNERVLVSS